MHFLKGKVKMKNKKRVYVAILFTCQKKITDHSHLKTKLVSCHSASNLCWHHFMSPCLLSVLDPTAGGKAMSLQSAIDISLAFAS